MEKPLKGTRLESGEWQVACNIVHVRADTDQTRTEWMEKMGRSEQWEGRRVSQTW